MPVSKTFLSNRFFFHLYDEWLPYALQLLIGQQAPVSHGADVVAAPRRAEIVGEGPSVVVAHDADGMARRTLQHDGLVDGSRVERADVYLRLVHPWVVRGVGIQHAASGDDRLLSAVEHHARG